MPEKKDVKRIRVALGPEREAELEHLMKVWGLDRNAAVCKAISEYARKIKLEEQLETGKGKGDGERQRED
jgi:hypothetical protein